MSATLISNDSLAVENRKNESKYWGGTLTFEVGGRAGGSPVLTPATCPALRGSLREGPPCSEAELCCFLTQGIWDRAPGSGPTQDRALGRAPRRPGIALPLLSVESTPLSGALAAGGSAQGLPEARHKSPVPPHRLLLPSQGLKGVPASHSDCKGLERGLIQVGTREGLRGRDRGPSSGGEEGAVREGWHPKVDELEERSEPERG